MDECPICGATVAVTKQYQHRRWHQLEETRSRELGDEVEKLEHHVQQLGRTVQRQARTHEPH